MPRIIPVHGQLCELHQLERKEKWYEHVPEGVVENGEVLLWDMNTYIVHCNVITLLKQEDLTLS